MLNHEQVAADFVARVNKDMDDNSGAPFVSVLHIGKAGFVIHAPSNEDHLTVVVPHPEGGLVIVDVPMSGVYALAEHNRDSVALGEPPSEIAEQFMRGYDELPPITIAADTCDDPLFKMLLTKRARPGNLISRTDIHEVFVQMSGELIAAAIRQGRDPDVVNEYIMDEAVPGLVPTVESMGFIVDC